MGGPRTLKRPKVERGGHVRLYWCLLDSNAWRALSWADQGLYVAMRRHLKVSNNGKISSTIATLRHSDVTSRSMLARWDCVHPWPWGS
jgi:hypothetical protein